MAAAAASIAGEVIPFHLIGSGSVGLFWAASIRSAFPSYPINVLLRSHHKHRVMMVDSSAGGTNVSHQLQGLKEKVVQVVISRRYDAATPNHDATGKILHDNSTSLVHVPVEILRDSNEEATEIEGPPSMIRNLIVSTKAHQAVQAVESVLPSLTPDGCNIILLCNGALSVRDELRALLEAKNGGQSKEPKIVLATTTHGVYQESSVSSSHTEPSLDAPFNPSGNLVPNAPASYHIIHAGYGKTYIQDVSQFPGLTQIWNDSGLNCRPLSESEMTMLLWQKLAANCVINPLSALFHCRNGELLLEPHVPPLQHELLNEISNVAKKTIESQNESSQKELAGGNTDVRDKEKHDESEFDPRLSSYALSRFVNQVIQDTLYNKSSMLQDVSNNKGTEIDHLNGYIVQKGRALGVECPANEDVWHRIKELNKSDG